MPLKQLQRLGFLNIMDKEAPFSNTTDRNQGGWITFPFIIASTAALTLASGGWMANLIVYLIKEFRVKRIGAAQISNLVNGSTSLIPVLGAVIADSFLGCYSVVWISSFISFLGIVLLFLTTTIHSLRPPQHCEDGSSSLCKTPSKLQFSILYTGLTLASIGIGGLRSTITTMGANQFHKPKDRGVYFNWYFVTTYLGSVISSTAIVYIEDNVSWQLGFGLSVGANLLGSAIFLLGTRFYQCAKPENSPFTGIARVVVATIRKRKVLLSSESEDFYYGSDGRLKKNKVASAPTKSFRFLNRAALKSETDINPDGSVVNPWKTCTVQQVEELKTLIRIFPIWSSRIFLGTPIGMQSSLAILQALTMDRHLGPNFKIPPASVLVFVLISTAIFLTILDRLLIPLSQKLFDRVPSPLQRIGIGHLLNIISMAVSALVESKRHKVAQTKHLISVLWLVPQLAVVGIGEAFHFPGQVDLYYQEFPDSLKSLSTAMIFMIIAIAFYLSTALIDLVRKVTGWLPDDINYGRLDNVYWVLVVIGVLNFGYYVVCACLYKYQNVEEVEDESSRSSL